MMFGRRSAAVGCEASAIILRWLDPEASAALRTSAGSVRSGMKGMCERVGSRQRAATEQKQEI